MSSAPVLLGIISAALFGISTPLSKLLLGSLSQFQLAGLLYLGAGLGMVPFVIHRRRSSPRHRLDPRNTRRVVAAVLFGGCLGPVFLLLGLTAARASSVSLWLNLELAATAILGRLFFRDHLGRAGAVGAAGALAAGVLVTVSEGPAGVVPALWVCAACVCWGLDNNLTSTVDALTPPEMTMVKGLVAGTVNLFIGTITSGSLPPAAVGLESLLVGALCYGGSIVLFITAAQRMGAARGQVVFASAPFFGVLASFLLLAERPSWYQAAAVVVFLGAIALMLRGRHSHRHLHEPLVHIHAHRHDDLHHDHAHPGLPPGTVHTHPHVHEPAEHEHPHLPDLHHRHPHAPGQ